MNPEALIAESFLLIPHTVNDLVDFCARPEHYLVSIEREGARAAALWFDRAARNPCGRDGLVHLLYHGRHLIPVDLWDDVTGIWLALLDVVDGFLDTGAGRATLSGQPAEIAMTGTPRNGTFTANNVSHRVDPAEVLPGLLAGADHYFRWVHHAIGDAQVGILARISAQRERVGAGLRRR